MAAKKRATRKKKGKRTKKETFTAEEIANALGHIVDWIQVLRRLLRSMPKKCITTKGLDFNAVIGGVVVDGNGEKIGCPPSR